MFNYDPPMSYYEEPERRRRCVECEEHDLTKDTAAEYIKDICDMLYSPAVLDTAKLEEKLDNLCWLFEVKTNPGELQIERPKKFKVSFLQLFPHLGETG